MAEMRGVRWSSRDARALAVGFLLVAASWLPTRGYPAWSEWRGQAVKSAAELTGELARSEALLDAFPSSLDSLEARLERLRAMDVALFRTEGADQMRAALGRVLTDAAARASVQLHAVEPELGDSPDHGLPRIRARVRAVGDVAGLVRLLAELQESPRMLSVTELSVTAADVAASANEPERLDFRMQVEALGLPPTAAAPATAEPTGPQ